MFYERSWSYGLLQKLRTYGRMWSCSVFDLSYWHQQLALICQIKPTVLLTEPYWPLSEGVFLSCNLLLSSSCHTRLSGHFQPTFTAPYDTIFLPDNFLSLGIENVRNCNISWPDNGGFTRSSQSAQTAIEVLSVVLNVFSMLSLRTIIVLHCTLSNGYCSSVCHVSFIMWICKVVSFFL